MGRKSFYNGNIPGSIRWNNDINKTIKNVKKEAIKINTIDYDYANEINNFINVGEKWLSTEFWE